MLQTANSTDNQSALLRDYVTYNQWANKTLVNWLKTKPQGLMESEITSSFPSIMATIVHIWDVQRIWLGHLEQQPVKSFRMEPFPGTLEEVFEGILDVSERFADYVHGLDESEIEAGCHFSIPYVGEHTIPAFEIIHHCMNHSTYHRGQVVTIGRNLGLTDAPMTDYMFYLLRAKPAITN